MDECELELGGGALPVLRTGDGPLVVCTHAFGPAAWGRLDRLASSFTVAVPIWQRATLDFQTSVTMRWFDPLLDLLGHERAALCAWSMAGPGAIAFAADSPSRLSHLVLVDVAGLAETAPRLRWRDLPHAILSAITRRPTRGFVRGLCRTWVHRRDLDTSALEEAAFAFFRSTPDALGAPGGGDDHDEDEDADDDEDVFDGLADELAEIEVPTLVVVGRHSTVLGPEHGASAAAAVKNGSLVVLDGSGHAPQLEEPDAFQDAILAFLERT